MNIDYVAETDTDPKLRAWLTPEDPNDDGRDLKRPRHDGWRLVIETADERVQFEPLRSARDFRIEDILRQMEFFWKTKPEWRIYQTGEPVDIYSELGL